MNKTTNNALPNSTVLRSYPPTLDHLNSTQDGRVKIGSSSAIQITSTSPETDSEQEAYLLSPCRAPSSSIPPSDDVSPWMDPRAPSGSSSSSPATGLTLDTNIAGPLELQNTIRTPDQTEHKLNALQGDIRPMKRLRLTPQSKLPNPQPETREPLCGSSISERQNTNSHSQSSFTRSGISSSASESDTRFPSNLGGSLIIGPAFSRARNFVLNNPILFDSPAPDSREMKYLSRHVIPHSSLNSDLHTRFPPRRCLPGTCDEIRDRTASWLENRNRRSNLLWLYGPAGAGVSSISRTVAQECQARGCLGAALFLPSRKKEDSIPLASRIIPSLAYQLAISLPAYRSHVTAILHQDPLFLEQEGLDSQFERLIRQPLLGNNLTTARQMVIILDGLDKCPEDESRRDLIRLVSAFADSANRYGRPFLWIITSRRERDIVSAFKDASMHCHKEELRIDTSQAKDDVSRFLRHGFQTIHRSHRDTFTTGTIWPTESQLAHSSTSAAGLFAFGAAILEFVNSDCPADKWEECSRFLNEGHPDCNPLISLHTLYEDIVDTIPQDILPKTKTILTFVLENKELPAETAAERLSLPRTSFYSALRRLHSVLEVPELDGSWSVPLLILHKSFGDFLRLKFGLRELDHGD